MSISFVRTALLAGLVCLSAACTSLDSSMKRYVGKSIDIVYERYGRAPDTERVKVGENRYSYFWRFTYYYPGTPAAANTKAAAKTAPSSPTITATSATASTVTAPFSPIRKASSSIITGRSAIHGA